MEFKFRSLVIELNTKAKICHQKLGTHMPLLIILTGNDWTDYLELIVFLLDFQLFGGEFEDI